MRSHVRDNIDTATSFTSSRQVFGGTRIMPLMSRRKDAMDSSSVFVGADDTAGIEHTSGLQVSSGARGFISRVPACSLVFSDFNIYTNFLS
jgi:hypothetical protein